MTLNPKKIYEDLEREGIDNLTAIDLLIYLIGNNDNVQFRQESIKTLLKIGVKNDKVFSCLEDTLVSDPNQEIRELGAQSLKILFQEKALPPLKWALDHEKSWQILLSIVSLIQELNTLKAKSVLFDKIKKIDDYKFVKSLRTLIKTEEIQSLKSKNLAEIINNYVVINHLKEILKEINYQIEDGLVVELDLSFTSNDTFGWKILKHLSEFISVIDNLKRLELKSNKLGKFPDSIFSLNSITYLDLSHNNINRLPDQFNNLQSLEYLNLRYNQLKEIPKSIGTLTNLKILDLKHNKLTNLPPSMGKLSSLEVLNLHGNQLNTLPSSIKDLSSLEKLKLGLNNLKSVPKWINNLSSLKKLSLGGNKSLYKIEEWLDFLPPITELNLYDNDIKILPESIGSLDSLEVLILPNNHLTILPESFKKLSSLKKLDLSWNDIADLPKWIGSLSSLEELNLRGNKLSKLPESMRFLHSLKILNITLNKNIIQPPKDLENKGLQIFI